jgi:hypothetical protein
MRMVDTIRGGSFEFEKKFLVERLFFGIKQNAE